MIATAALALLAAGGHIRTQFLTAAILLALIGGVAGVLAGAAATGIYTHHKGWATVIPHPGLGRRAGHPWQLAAGP